MLLPDSSFPSNQLSSPISFVPEEASYRQLLLSIRYGESLPKLAHEIKAFNAAYLKTFRLLFLSGEQAVSGSQSRRDFIELTAVHVAVLENEKLNFNGNNWLQYWRLFVASFSCGLSFDGLLDFENLYECTCGKNNYWNSFSIRKFNYYTKYVSKSSVPEHL